MSADTSEPALGTAARAVHDAADSTTWLVASYAGPSSSAIVLRASGPDPALAARDALEEVNDVAFAYLLVREKGLVVLVLSGAGGVRRAKAIVHARAFAALFPEYLALATLNAPKDLTEQVIAERLGLLLEDVKAASQPKAAPKAAVFADTGADSNGGAPAVVASTGPNDTYSRVGSSGPSSSRSSTAEPQANASRELEPPESADDPTTPRAVVPPPAPLPPIPERDATRHTGLQYAPQPTASRSQPVSPRPPPSATLPLPSSSSVPPTPPMPPTPVTPRAPVDPSNVRPMYQPPNHDTLPPRPSSQPSQDPRPWQGDGSDFHDHDLPPPPSTMATGVPIGVGTSGLPGPGALTSPGTSPTSWTDIPRQRSVSSSSARTGSRDSTSTRPASRDSAAGYWGGRPPSRDASVPTSVTSDSRRSSRRGSDPSFSPALSSRYSTDAPPVPPLPDELRYSSREPLRGEPQPLRVASVPHSPMSSPLINSPHSRPTSTGSRGEGFMPQALPVPDPPVPAIPDPLPDPTAPPGGPRNSTHAPSVGSRASSQMPSSVSSPSVPSGGEFATDAFSHLPPMPGMSYTGGKALPPPSPVPDVPLPPLPADALDGPIRPARTRHLDSPDARDEFFPPLPPVPNVVKEASLALSTGPSSPAMSGSPRLSQPASPRRGHARSSSIPISPHTRTRGSSSLLSQKSTSASPSQSDSSPQRGPTNSTLSNLVHDSSRHEPDSPATDGISRSPSSSFFSAHSSVIGLSDDPSNALSSGPSSGRGSSHSGLNVAAAGGLAVATGTAAALLNRSDEPSPIKTRHSQLAEGYSTISTSPSLTSVHSNRSNMSNSSTRAPPPPPVKIPPVPARAVPEASTKSSPESPKPKTPVSGASSIRSQPLSQPPVTQTPPQPSSFKLGHKKSNSLSRKPVPPMDPELLALTPNQTPLSKGAPTGLDGAKTIPGTSPLAASAVTVPPRDSSRGAEINRPPSTAHSFDSSRSVDSVVIPPPRDSSRSVDTVRDGTPLRQQGSIRSMRSTASSTLEGVIKRTPGSRSTTPRLPPSPAFGTPPTPSSPSLDMEGGMPVMPVLGMSGPRAANPMVRTGSNRSGSRVGSPSLRESTLSHVGESEVLTSTEDDDAPARTVPGVDLSAVGHDVVGAAPAVLKTPPMRSHSPSSLHPDGFGIKSNYDLDPASPRSILSSPRSTDHFDESTASLASAQVVTATPAHARVLSFSNGQIRNFTPESLRSSTFDHTPRDQFEPTSPRSPPIPPRSKARSQASSDAGHEPTINVTAPPAQRTVTETMDDDDAYDSQSLEPILPSDSALQLTTVDLTSAGNTPVAPTTDALPTQTAPDRVEAVTPSPPPNMFSAVTPSFASSSSLTTSSTIKPPTPAVSAADTPSSAPVRPSSPDILGAMQPQRRQRGSSLSSTSKFRLPFRSPRHSHSHSHANGASTGADDPLSPDADPSSSPPLSPTSDRLRKASLSKAFRLRRNTNTPPGSPPRRSSIYSSSDDQSTMPIEYGLQGLGLGSIGLAPSAYRTPSGGIGYTPPVREPNPSINAQEAFEQARKRSIAEQTEALAAFRRSEQARVSNTPSLTSALSHSQGSASRSTSMRSDRNTHQRHSIVGSMSTSDHHGPSRTASMATSDRRRRSRVTSLAISSEFTPSEDSHYYPEAPSDDTPHSLSLVVVSAAGAEPVRSPVEQLTSAASAARLHRIAARDSPTSPTDRSVPDGHVPIAPQLTGAGSTEGPSDREDEFHDALEGGEDGLVIDEPEDTTATRELDETDADGGAEADHAQAEAERAGAERLESQRQEKERLRAEADKLHSERLEEERLEAQRAEEERLAAERAEQERQERVEQERLEAERREAERAEAERVEAERLEAERVEAERRETERLEAQRVEAERLEAERLEAERKAEEERERREAEEKARREREEAERKEREARERADVKRQLSVGKKDGGIMLRGWITVQTMSSPTWRRRYFHLLATELRLFKADYDAKPLTIAPIPGAKVSQDYEESAVAGSWKLLAGDGKEYYMYADSSDDRATILEGLAIAIAD